MDQLLRTARSGAAALALAGTARGDPPPAKPVASMTLEELVSVEVTTVSRKAEHRLDAAAAVTVITREDIRRSGATTIPEALRLAPGVQVARIGSNRWAIGIRGFASRLSRSLLVLIDGRSVYNPLFAGVYWEVQDTLLEDVERIEVIRGPGGTLWGANAVNGVINIITRSAADTRGGIAAAGAGTEERIQAAARYGASVGQRFDYRVYGKYSDRDDAFHPTGGDDAWRMGQLGFRSDGEVGDGATLTAQGDAYVSSNGERSSISSYTPPYVTSVQKDATLSGGNLLGRYRRAPGDGTELTLQGYYDRTHRREPEHGEDVDTIDLDVSHRFRLPLSQEITWGAGFRWIASEVQTIETLRLASPSRTDRVYSAFVQDEIPIVRGRVRLTAGVKLEHNDYSGFELQPSARLLVTPRDGHVLWASVSRAVRTPSRLEHELILTNALRPDQPVFLRVTGDPRVSSEEVVAYEAGYRLQAGPRLLVDLAAFHDRYTDLISIEPGAPFVEAGSRQILPFAIRNGIAGRGTGGELALDAVVTEAWKVRLGYAYLSLDLGPQGGSADTSTGPSTEGASPRHQVSMSAYLNLPAGLSADVTGRYVARLPAQGVGGYANADLRIGWVPAPSLELSLVGQGLLHARRREFGGSSATEIQRGVYGKLTWRF